MRLPEAKIKTAILRSEEEVRVTAVSYFADSYSTDPEIMPLVIQAIEMYGRESAFSILRDAERLSQTPATLDWLMNELRRDFDIKKINDDNFRFAIGLVVLAAPVDLLATKKKEIDELDNFAEELRGPLDERLAMATWTWDQGWEALDEFGRNTMKKGDFTQNDQRHAGRIIESLARFREGRGDVVLALLGRQYPAKGKRLMRWLEPHIIELAGEMKLEGAIPILVGLLGSDDLALSDSSTRALMRIGTDAVVKAIVDNWDDGSDHFRGGAADVLDTIHTDPAEQNCLTFLEDEDDFDTAFALANAVLSHFSFDGIKPVRDFLVIDQDDWSPDHYDLKYHLIAATTIMDARFPKYDAWYRDAVKTNWGWGERERRRLADAFRADPIGPKKSRNGQG